MNTLSRKVPMATVLIGCGLLSQLARPAVPSTADRARIAVERTAAETALPAEALSVTRATTVSLPLQGRNAYAFKILDKTTGKLLSRAVDEGGNDVDGEDLFKKEQALYESWYGRVDERLVDRLTAARISDLIPVQISIKTPTQQEAAIGDLEASSAKDPGVAARAEGAVAAARAQQTERVQPVVGPVVARLAALGYRVSWNGTVPILHVSLSPEDLQKVGRWREVLRVYPEVAAKSLGDVNLIVRPTVGADYVQGRGITGAVKIAQVEVGGAVNPQNPYLPNVLRDLNASVCYLTGNPDHSAAVAGVLRYIATGAQILATGSCSGNGAQLQDRAAAAISWGAAVTNNSWGEDRLGGADSLLDANDWAYDYYVINSRRLEVVAAGNDGQRSGYVGSPGSAYNVLTVGNFDDKNSVAWTGPVDVMYPTSSFRNPSSTYRDRQKPEVAAPGANLVSATNSGTWWAWVGSGTSYAAPVVSGIAAMMIQRSPALVNFPVAAKAILMATATHNIEGASRLSDWDGAGGVWAPYADAVTAGGANGSWGAMNYTCATPSKVVASVPLVAGKLARVVIAWNTDPNDKYYYTRPSADYDLVIQSPLGAVVASSSSYDNTYEIVEFTPSATGTYSIGVNKARCDLSPRTLAYAWWRAQ